MTNDIEEQRKKKLFDHNELLQAKLNELMIPIIDDFTDELQETIAEHMDMIQFHGDANKNWTTIDAQKAALGIATTMTIIAAIKFARTCGMPLEMFTSLAHEIYAHSLAMTSAQNGAEQPERGEPEKPEPA